MKNIVGVKFKKEGKIYTFHAADLPLKRDDLVVVITDNGPAIGTVATEVKAVPDEQLAANLKNVLRLATEEDFRIRENNQKLEQEAMQFCVRKIAERQLPMKMIDVECLFDKSKMLFSFAAENRVDFRDLVKDLVQRFRTRIELRQIGAQAGGPRHQGARNLRTGGVLRDPAAHPGPGFGQDGQGAEHVPEPREDLRPLREADVLPGLRI